MKERRHMYTENIDMKKRNGKERRHSVDGKKDRQ